MFTEVEYELLEKACRTEDLKKNNYDSMANCAENVASAINVTKQEVIRFKDYMYYMTNCWKDGDPLNLAPGKYPDRVSKAFIKILQIIDDCNNLCNLDILDPYFEALKRRGITIIVDKSNKAGDKYQAYKDIVINNVKEMCEYQCNICNLSDSVKIDMAEEARQKSICAKDKFVPIVRLYNRYKHNDRNGKNNEKVIDKFVNMHLDASMTGNCSQELIKICEDSLI
jgi:hypothetical protein